MRYKPHSLNAEVEGEGGSGGYEGSGYIGFLPENMSGDTIIWDEGGGQT